jgi:hypothetical protein
MPDGTGFSSKVTVMTTEQLIELLVADLTPVSRRRIMRTMILALAIGTAAAFGAMLLIFNPRPELQGGRSLDTLLIKILFASGVAATAAVLLPQLARPDVRMRSLPKFVFIPFVAVAALAAVALASSDWSIWAGMIVGRDWMTCLFSIPALTVIPFASLIWALRMGAPTDPMHAGEIAGLVAGGRGALACALPCVDGALPSSALWYGFPIGMCATAGAKIGPSLLRW